MLKLFMLPGNRHLCVCDLPAKSRGPPFGEPNLDNGPRHRLIARRQQNRVQLLARVGAPLETNALCNPIYCSELRTQNSGITPFGPDKIQI